MTRRGLFGVLAAVVYGTWRRPAMAVVQIDGCAIAYATVQAWIDELHVHRTPIAWMPDEIVVTRVQGDFTN